MAPASLTGVGPVAVGAVELRRLRASGDQAPFLPEWAAAAVAPPAAWPENDEQYAIELCAECGVIGSFGPCAPAVARIVRDQIAPALIGLDVTRTRAFEYLQPSGRHRTGAHFRIARSAVELALWDLRSRIAAEPLAALLGGPLRDDVPAYASALGVDIGHPLAGDVSRWIREQGFVGQKWSLEGRDPRGDAAQLARIRSAVGADHPIMVDARGQWSTDYTRRVLPRLAELDVAWVEDVPPVDTPTSVPIAGGEQAYDPLEQHRLLTSGTIDVWQPDVGWHGGLGPSLRMVDLAAELGLRVFPHGGCLAGAVTLAAVAAESVVPAVEYHLTVEPRRAAVTASPLRPVAGALAVRSDAGLGAGYRFEGDDRSGG